VYVLGLVYTLFRVKVPYIPTPKDDRPRNNFVLVLPNLLLLLATTFAMSFCIYHYWRFALRNEFVLLMLGFAAINAVVLGGNVVAGQEAWLLRFFHWVDRRSERESALSVWRVRAWQVRYGLYGWLRQSAIPLFAVMLVLAGGLMAYTIVRKTSTLPQTLRYANTQAFYVGTETALPVMRHLIQADEQRIAPQHLTWPLRPYEPIETPRLSGHTNELPLLYLEPELGAGHTERTVQDFLEGIMAGRYDAPLLKLATQVRTYPGPVLISLMPQFDDPRQPWGMTHQFTLLRYRQAWQYIVAFMREHRAYDLCWLWCPALSNTIVEQYPGDEWVDWLGLTAVDNPTLAPDQKPHSFATLFQQAHYAVRMHKTYSIRQKPILLTRFGTVAPPPERTRWTAEALGLIKARYPQVRGVIF
jgi:cellulose synthase (UDP-forming)